MPLTSLKSPITSNTLITTINNNDAYLDTDKISISAKGTAGGVASLDASSNVIQNALTSTNATNSTTANNYNTTTGTIQSKFTSIDTIIGTLATESDVVLVAQTFLNFLKKFQTMSTNP